MSVYGSDEQEPFHLGHLDISRSTGWNSLPICPSSLTNEASSESYLTFTGTSGLNFTVEIIQEETIKLDEQKEVTINQWNRVEVFQFDPTENISDTQLDVTVTSESADVPAYLKVSRDCKDVKDNIYVVDYKGESLRLSFAKKGRITLSKFSIPPLTDSSSSWFIGIAINNASGNVSLDATKTVVLTLTRSFDYTYSKPLIILVLVVSCFVGLVVSLWAWCSFRDYIISPCTAEGLSITKLQVTWPEFFSAMRIVMCNYSFGRGPKTYSYITFIVGSVLMVGAFQFVFADWYLMIHEGDRDHCYYNDFCYRVRYYDIPYNLMMSNVAYIIHGLILALNVLCMESDLLARCKKLAAKDDPYENISDNKSDQAGRDYKYLPNHMLICPDISPHLETMLVPRYAIKKNKASEMFAEARKKRFSFTIGYAFAWALTFEGFFSALYHLCPSRLTFQFDTAFMFVIASLIVVLLYNGIEIQKCSINVTDRVAAANFFLYFLVPLYFFNYLGTMYHSEAGLITSVKITFFVFMAIWCVCMVWWASYKLYPEKCSKIWSKIKCEKKGSSDEPNNAGREGRDETLIKRVKALFYFMGVGIVPVVFLILLITERMDFPDVFLFACITESLAVIFGKVLVKLITFCKNFCCALIECTWQCTGHDVALFLSKIVYVMVTLGIGIAALWFFLGNETTDKVKTPEKSRDLNKECYWLDFFDHHDIWHILSSFTLFMGALMVLHVSYEPPKETQNQSAEGNTFSRMRLSMQSLV